MAASIETKPPIRILVGIASYGTNNDPYLEEIIRRYKSMPFKVDIVVFSNIEKNLGADIECTIGLPNKNPWSLPFAHKKLFVERANSYDLFVYSEDDILIAEQTIRAWLNVTAELLPNEVAGFLRIEFGSNGEVNYPDAHAHFHWDPSSVRRRGAYTLTHFTNEHAACYVLNQAQLAAALRSGGFDVAPHEGKYDLLCTAATDPYTQCGFTKLIPVSHLNEFTVHHMSNRYVGKMGVTAEEFDRQIDVLLRIADCPPKALIPTETRLWRNAYSKDYYEPIREQFTSQIPPAARSVLSIGCGSGAVERWLAKKGLRVAAIPLDPVIASGAAADGVEMFYEDLEDLKNKKHFDCVLCSNILHLAPTPEKWLSLMHTFMHGNSTLIIQTPNMMSLKAIRSRLKDGQLIPFVDYTTMGTHFSSARSIRKWCSKAGFRIEKISKILPHPGDGRAGLASAIAGHLPRLFLSPFASSIVVTATRKVN